MRGERITTGVCGNSRVICLMNVVPFSTSKSALSGRAHSKASREVMSAHAIIVSQGEHTFVGSGAQGPGSPDMPTSVIVSTVLHKALC